MTTRFEMMCATMSDDIIELATTLAAHADVEAVAADAGELADDLDRMV